MGYTNKQILQQANAAITKGDYEGFLEYCTESTTWHFIGDQVLKGKQAVRDYMAKVYTEPPEFEVEHLIAENDFVTALGTIKLNDEAGNKHQYDYCDVWRFVNGKMAELKAFVITGK